MENNKLKIAVIFDMDGVVVDNAGFHFKSWVILAKTLGVKLTKEYYLRHLNGRKGEEIVKYLSKKHFSKKELEYFVNEEGRIYRREYKKYIKPVKGLVKFLSALKGGSIKIAMATSAPRANVDFVMKSTGIKKYFKNIVGAAHVTHGKPHPEVFLKASGLLKANPNRCIVFEDALNGVEAAQRAKMKVVAVSTTNKPSQLRHADLVIKDFTEINIGKLEKLFN